MKEKNGMRDNLYTKGLFFNLREQIWKKKGPSSHTARSDTILSQVSNTYFEVLDVMAQMWYYIIFLAINQQKWL